MNNSETRMQEAIYDISLNVADFMKQTIWNTSTCWRWPGSRIQRARR